MNFEAIGKNFLILFMVAGLAAAVLSYNVDLQTNTAYAQSDVEERQRQDAEEIEREARAATADAEREARQEAQQIEREERHAAEDAERDARDAAEDIEREARSAASDIEREARQEAQQTERETRQDAEEIERVARAATADAEREARQIAQEIQGKVRQAAEDAGRDAERMQQRGLVMSEEMRDRGLAIAERMQQRGLIDGAPPVIMSVTGVNIGETISERRAIAEIKSEVIIEELEQRIRHGVISVDSRVQSLLERLELGRYHLPESIDEDNQKNSLNISFEGQTREGVSEPVVGSIFLENVATRGDVIRYKVTGGEIFLGDTAYDVVFGKARLVASPQHDIIIILGQIMDIDGNVSTFRLGVESDGLKDGLTSGNADFKLAPHSKIANKYIHNGVFAMDTGGNGGLDR